MVLGMQLSILITAVLLVVVEPQATNQRVHDFANLLSAEQRQSLEEVARDVEHKTTAQFAIVTVNSLDGQTVESYAHELFNKWGIGKGDTNNGVLFLIAPNERRMRFEVGDGIERLLPDSLVGEISDKHIVPRFKANDYAGGIVAGANAVAAVVLAKPDLAHGVPNSGPVLAHTGRLKALFATSSVALTALGMFIFGIVVAWRRVYSTLTFLTVTAALVALVAIAAYLVWQTPKFEQPLGLFGGAATASVAAWGLNLARYRRYGPHGCSKCGAQLELLSEQADDPKLSSVQQLEEKIGSVDYDVWICPACLNSDTERYIKAFSSFTECPKCKGRTFKEDPQTVLTAPTRFSTGLAEVEGRCVNCNYKSLRQVILPMLPTPTSNSGSTWSGGGSSSGGTLGGGGGGSFGGGGGSVGGFGGGSSSGGGASRGW
jgi:uncharacterized protein